MIKKPIKVSFNHGRIDMSHGAGGRAMHDLIEQLFIAEFSNEFIDRADDYALLPSNSPQMVMASDSYVVSPLFFPGGNIGELAVNGTVNDVAMSGARVKFLSASFILEEGFELKLLKKIVQTMATSCQQAGVKIVTGDTKVVEKKACDGVFINTTGFGELDRGVSLSKCPKVGDKIIINGDIGDHGVAILASRENLSFSTEIQSDTAPLNGLIANMLQVAPTLRCLRDPTRGGVAAVMNEWAYQYGVSFRLDESTLPVKQAVKSACELMGFDVLNLANEGKVLACCPAQEADNLVDAMRQHYLGRQAAIIGEVIEQPHACVLMKTCIGGLRLVDWIAGEQLPRIC